GMDTADDPEVAMAPEQMHLLQDIFTGVLLVLGISILLIAVSALINQVADIYDRADTFQDLRAAGMEPGTMHRAMVRAAMGPALRGGSPGVHAGPLPPGPRRGRPRRPHPPTRAAGGEAPPRLRRHGGTIPGLRAPIGPLPAHRRGGPAGPRGRLGGVRRVSY